jgi:hypothetical protein
MIIKLPIVINDKINNIKFKLTKHNNYLILTLEENILLNDKMDNESIIKILVHNNINVYEYLNIYLPLKLHIVGSYILTYYFFTINIISNLTNNLDFFYNLNKIIQSKYNLQFIPISKFSHNKSNIIEFINNQYNFINNSKKHNKEFWDMINLLLNSICFTLYIKENIPSKNKIIKKIQLLTNIFKNFKYSINQSNKYIIDEHQHNINNNSLSLADIEINNNYFLLINNTKLLYVKIISISDNIIIIDNFVNNIDFTKYKWYKYSPDIKLHINIIYFNFINSKEVLSILINKYVPKLNIDVINNIISYFKENQIKSKLHTFILENNSNDVQKTDLEIIKSNSFTIDYFKSICTTYSTSYISILEILLENYVYPIKYNKKEIDPLFDYILYISLLNINTILLCSGKDKIFLNQDIKLPVKLKQLYYNILKTFYQIINKHNYTINFITDNIHIQFIKIFLTSKTITLTLLTNIVTLDEINKFKNMLLINFYIIDIINQLSWNNISNRLLQLKILLKNKEHIYFHDKLNKNIFPEHFDNRIKSIIINPIDMFKYLEREIDFIKWIYFLEDKCINLYIIPISLSNDDFEVLGKLIYNLINIKEQSLNDKYYKQFIYYSVKYPKIILNNSRINLNIREHFGYLKCNINLGFLAKHITQNKENITELNNDDEITILKQQIILLTNKYVKYKNKYNKIKQII